MAEHSTRIKTRFLILSDTHSATPSQNISNEATAFRPPLPQANVILHCGDLTMLGLVEEYEKTLEMLGGMEAELKLVIAGNHDITLDAKYYARKGEFMHSGYTAFDPDLPRRARELWLGEGARRAGVTYLEEGTHTFTLANGARLRVYASPYQPEFCDWAFPYFRNQDRYNANHQSTQAAECIAENPVPDFPHVDVMMTHGPPMGILDTVGTGEHVGCEHLLRASRRCRPRLHCFGHIHEGWGAQLVRWREDTGLDASANAPIERLTDIDVDAERMVNERGASLDISSGSGMAVEPGKDTLMVNASIMTLSYKPWNGPWIVDLDLERDT
ncbi:similar to ser/Thr protein phosphatase family protein [Plenodomus lingam JN3]|uniref:Similar to ser/Thr protein phosphatase family protein n=1 Tax=Leptosphaeria maculans (strain JN3 / isolate v23.1.3 / race Av1-4-5-6-7-8) TaxID=985895 RepID=E4ZPR6_LEPMJ|nr:similar to ser/Thr protein phosphatase family protein [Plenodomus lingam JN3]CBX93451.1 similar to ser/Thr protein phosphatase family protein [Plenodomus lingam JN3]